MKSKLRQFSFEWLKKMDKPFIFLEDNYSKFINQYYTTESEDFGRIIDSRKPETLKALKEQYNEEFIAIQPRIKSEGFSHIYSPVNDMSIKFDVHSIEHSNKYACVMAQKMVTKTVNKIIKSKGYEDRIVVFTTSDNETDTHSEQYNLKVDFSKIQTEEDEIKFMNEIFPAEMEITIYYLLTEDEKIDYKTLKEIGEDFQAVYPNYEGHVNTFFIYFIWINEENRKIAVDLFKDKDSTEGYFRNRREGLDFTDMFLVRTDHEGFRFLDVYGEKLDFIYWIDNDLKNLTLTEFTYKNKRNGVWRD